MIDCGRAKIQWSQNFSQESTMKRCLLLACGIAALLAGQMPANAQAQGAKGKNCHMEQQCHWENFKKVCVYVKVCR
jgi:hypothetical protein